MLTHNGVAFEIGDVLQVAPGHPWGGTFVTVIDVNKDFLAVESSTPDEYPLRILLFDGQYKYIGKAAYIRTEENPFDFESVKTTP